MLQDRAHVLYRSFFLFVLLFIKGLFDSRIFLFFEYFFVCALITRSSRDALALSPMVHASCFEIKSNRGCEDFCRSGAFLGLLRG